MEPTDIKRAIAAATTIAASLRLPADDVIVLHNSNKVTLRLVPSNVLARVAPEGEEVAQFEIDLARRLAATNCPVGVLEPRAEARVYRLDGFAVTLWRYYEAIPSPVSPVEYAQAMVRLHAGMRMVQVDCHSFMDRVTQAEAVVTDAALSPRLSTTDRSFLSGRLRYLRRTIRANGASEQLLHGEPHPGNVLNTKSGPLFIDWETCCRGPVEFDLAHVPAAVSNHYPGIDPGLLDDCRQLVLAMVAAWRWELRDQFPDGKWFGEEFLRLLRAGPPWPTLDTVTRQPPGQPTACR